MIEIPKNIKLVPFSLIPLGTDCPMDDTFSLYKLGVLMEILCDDEEGVGLSAVQIGVPLNFFIVKYGDKYRHFVNCKVSSASEEKEVQVEGCLSIKTDDGKLRYFEVERFKEIRIVGTELILDGYLQFKQIDFIETGLPAKIIQHEEEHSRQITIDMTGKEIYVWR